MKRLWGAIIVGLVMLGAMPASAATIPLTANNLGLTGTFGTVTYNLLTPTTASFLFQSSPGFLFGGQGAAALNLASAATVSGLTSTNTLTGFTPGPVSEAAPGNEDGFGSFNKTFDSFDGYTHANQTISFTLTKNTGTWATVGDILALNGTNGYNAAAHIFQCSSLTCDVNQMAIQTGYAAGDGSTNPPPPPPPPPPPGVVPEPSSMVLLGTGLLGFAAMARRRRKQ